MYERPYDLVLGPDGYGVRIRARGNQVLTSPLLNRGTAFTAPQQRALGLTGLLPTEVTTMTTQLRRVYAQYGRQPGDLAKNVYLGNLRDHAIDRDGLLGTGQAGRMYDFQARYARRPEELADWPRDRAGRIGLAEVVSRVAPTHADRHVDAVRRVHRADRHRSGRGHGRAGSAWA